MIAKIVRDHNDKQIRDQEIQLGKKDDMINELRRDIAELKCKTNQIIHETKITHKKLDNTQDQLIETHKKLDNTQDQLIETHKKLDNTQEKLTETHKKLDNTQ